MRMFIPVTVLAVTAVPLLALTEDNNSVTTQETTVTRTISLGHDGPGITIDATADIVADGQDMPQSIQDMIRKAMQSGETVHRMELGDMGEMLFSVSMQDDRDRRQGSPEGNRNRGDRNRGPEGNRNRGDRNRGPEGNRNRGDRNRGPEGNRNRGDRNRGPEGDRNRGDRNRGPEGDRDRGGRNNGRMIELDLGELTNGQVHGNIVLDLADLMRGGNGRDHGNMQHEANVEIVIEDGNGRRHIVHGNSHDGAPMMFMSGMPAMPMHPGMHDVHGMHGVFGATGMPAMPMAMWDEEDHWDHHDDRHDDHHGDHERNLMREEMEHHLRGMEMMLDEHHHEMDDEERHELMREIEHLHQELERMHHGHDDHDEHDDHGDHRREIEEHLRELEMHLDRHHDEMSEGERRDIMMEMEHLHQELEHMDHREHHDDHGHHEDHDGHDEGDEYFHQAQEFVHKIHAAEAMGDALSNSQAVAIFSIWMARQHLEPQAQVEMLTPVMNDDNMQMSVRNAATWVVMEALAHMDRQDDAQATLSELIKRNGAINPQQ